MNKLQEFLIKVIRKTSFYKAILNDVSEVTLEKDYEVLNSMWQIEEYAKSIAENQLSIERLLKNEVMIGTDVHFKTDSVIVVISKIGNGRVQLIPAKAENLSGLKRMIEELKYRYYVDDKNLVYDLPYGVSKDLFK